MTATPELSRLVQPAQVPSGGQTIRVEATEAERAALARRLRIPALRALAATLELRPAHGGRVRATGRMRAEVAQTCVVTLEDFPQTVAEDLDWLLLPPGEAPNEDPYAEGPDEVESDAAGADLGEALAQALSLALDPYPRKPGAELPEVASDAAANPFAALAKLRARE